MKKHNINLKITIFSFLIIVFAINSCSVVPITGRKQISLISDSEITSLSFNQYDAFLKENPLSTDKKQTALVKEVGTNISKAVEQYFAQKGMSSQLKNFKWEFNLVADKTPNAWCMPGGKVVFYEGILPITKDANGIAVVMGHEIAHAVAKHGNERMSQQLAAQMAGTTLSVLLSEKPEQTKNLALTAFGAATQVGLILPYSRTHETEADRLGLIFMAMAGYNPSTAVDFWTRMSQMSGGNKTIPFLSTHPTDKQRIQDIKKVLSEAMKYYKK